MFNSTVNILSFPSPRVLPLYSLTLVYLSQSFLPPLNQYRSAIMHESSQASPLNQSCRSLYVSAAEHHASVLYLHAFPRNHLNVFLDIIFISAAQSASREKSGNDFPSVFNSTLSCFLLCCIVYRHLAPFGLMLKCQVLLNAIHACTMEGTVHGKTACV